LDSKTEHRRFSFAEDRQNFYYNGTKDKGYGNQNCLDFDFEPRTELCSPHVFVSAGECKKILLDAEIDGGAVEGNVGFSCYVDPTRQSDVRAFCEEQKLPFALDGNCGRRIYEIDISALDRPFFNFSLEFLSSGHAKVYAVELCEA
jgi:hypothetical protein